MEDLEASGAATHVPVLPEQVLGLLRPASGEVMLDCTLGRGGHARLIRPRLAPGGAYAAFDADPANIEAARISLASGETPIQLVHTNFARARAALDELGIDRVDLLLADLGFASTQMDDARRGFSFRADGPLDMRLDPTLPQTAADLVNHLGERELADLIFRFGEERLSRKIARKIAEHRERSPILTTSGLAEIVRGAYGGRAGSAGSRRSQAPYRVRNRIDPATRTFMALRIAVNQELEALERLLAQLPVLLRAGARAAVISFHSLEDRLVKRAFAELYRQGRAKRLTPKPVVASEAERRENPRSRSAKLRAIEWVQ